MLVGEVGDLLRPQLGDRTDAHELGALVFGLDGRQLALAGTHRQVRHVMYGRLQLRLLVLAVVCERVRLKRQ